MRALVADGSGVSFAEASDPLVDASHVLVEVKAVSLNRGEVRRLPARKPGTIPGWDVAGVLSDGTRVVGLADEGGWAELAALPKDRLSKIPDGVSFEAASALPVAGLTALRALEVGGALLGRRVLITGAAGGVGRFAIQLAHRAGAHVTGVVRNAERGEGLRELGADELITELEPEGEPFDLLLESVGGASLAAALTRVAPLGTVVAFGASSPDPTTFDVSGFYGRGGSRLYGLRVFDELVRHRSGVRDLTLLVNELAAGRLDPQIDLVTSWEDHEAAITALMDRRVAGKAVLTVG
jgi:NADPH:quinone reductase-like Zn-dependent oxidoreductase